MQSLWDGSILYLKLEIGRIDVVKGERDRRVKCVSKRDWVISFAVWTK